MQAYSRNSLQHKKKTIGTSHGCVCVDLLTLSEKEPRTIGVRVLVGHLMD